MVDAALHRVCVCISAVLQQQKTNATKRKKSTQEMFAKFKDSCSGDVAVAVTFDAAVGCTTACLPGCASASAFACIAQALRLCLRLTHTLSLADSLLSLCARVCVCVCFCLRLLCAFNFQFTAVPKLYLKANFAVAVAVSLPALCSNSSSRRS